MEKRESKDQEKGKGLEFVVVLNVEA